MVRVIPCFISTLPCFRYVINEKKDANTSAIRLTVIAAYAEMELKVTKSGVTIVAADAPAKPVTIPAPRPAIINRIRYDNDTINLLWYF